MKQKLISIIEKYDRISEKMAEPDIVTNVEKIKELSQEQKQLEEIVIVAKAYILLLEQIEEYKELSDSDDDELKMMAEEELISSEENQIKLEDQIKVLLLPKNPHDNKNLILEIRAGTGGDEAALFAADLYRLYTRFSERNNWKLKVIQSSGTGIGGFKEIIVALEGKGAYGKLKYESGVHRVQRVPKTETSGRVHTSAATVAVMPEAKDVDVSVNEGDLKIDTYRASGAGGQHVNKTESAIRITHIPTGLVVTCQDQSSQHKNRAAALKVLKSRLLAAEQDKVAKKRAAERKSLVSTGDR